MNIVLFHQGKNFPYWIDYCLYQLRMFNPDIPVYLLLVNADNEKFEKICKKYNVELVNDGNINFLDNYINHPSHDFWNVTIKRLFNIQRFAEKRNLKDIIIIENDILIYSNLMTILAPFTQNNSVLFTRGTDIDIMTGFSYFKTVEDLHKLNDFIAKTLQDRFNKNDKSFINEMVLISMYQKETGAGFELPTMPHHSMSEHGCFDPASWGQYAGGTPHNGQKPGWAETAHHIGKAILDKKYDLVFLLNRTFKDGEYISPYIQELETNRLFPLHNLHVHSKNLVPFLSKEYQ